MSEIEFVQLTTKADVEENRVACFEINGHSVVLSQFKGEFFALANMCSHAQQTFDNGRVRGHKLLCPLHGAIFDIRDGSVLGPPALRPIKSYPLKIENEEIYICLNVD